MWLGFIYFRRAVPNQAVMARCLTAGDSRDLTYTVVNTSLWKNSAVFSPLSLLCNCSIFESLSDFSHKGGGFFLQYGQCGDILTINGRSLCLSVLWLSQPPFIWSTSHLGGVLLRTHGSAVSSVKLFGWAVLEKAASSNSWRVKLAVMQW